MSKFTINTPRLDLTLQTPEEVLAWIESLPPSVRTEVSPDWIARVRTTSEGDYWALGFVMVERTSGVTVGTCAFKGPPNSDGAVEVAYGTEEEHRGRGFATEASAGLINLASGSDKVRLICAHTRAENAASSRVLAKCGFKFVGEVIDPEDGLVNRWERTPIIQPVAGA